MLVVLLLALAACRSAPAGNPHPDAAPAGGAAEAEPWTGPPAAVGGGATPAMVELDDDLTVPLRASVPRPARTLYEAAGARYGVSPAVLVALHAVESGSAGDGCVRNRQGSGEEGSLQFKPATFRAYGVDADGDGRANICGRADALYSAARYLKALGADAQPASSATRRALARYGTQVERVVALARDPTAVARLGVARARRDSVAGAPPTPR